MTDKVAQIHQGRYDTEKELLNLLDNAKRLNRLDAVDAVNQRLKIVAPKIYQRLVGPLYERNRDKQYKCYCNNPASLYKVYKDITSGNVPYDALTCDACWREDLAKTWGYYGVASNLISKEIWTELCDERAHAKFVGY